MRDPRTVQPPPPPAEIASSWGEAAELEALYHTKVAETLHHVEVAKTLGHLSNAFRALGEAVTAKARLERALEILEREYGLNHVKVAITLEKLGKTCHELGNETRSKALLERALPIFEATEQPNADIARRELGKVKITHI